VEAAGLTLTQADTIRLRKEKDDWLEGGLFCVEKDRDRLSRLTGA
jgi:hypothetical protein